MEPNTETIGRSRGQRRMRKRQHAAKVKEIIEGGIQRGDRVLDGACGCVAVVGKVKLMKRFRIPTPASGWARVRWVAYDPENRVPAQCQMWPGRTRMIRVDDEIT